MSESAFENGITTVANAAADVEAVATSILGGAAFDLGRRAAEALGATPQQIKVGEAAARGAMVGGAISAITTLGDTGATARGAGMGALAGGIAALEMTDLWGAAGVVAGGVAGGVGVEVAKAAAAAAKAGAKAAEAAKNPIIEGAKKVGNDILDTPKDVLDHVKKNPVTSIIEGAISPGLIIVDAKFRKWFGK